MRSSLSLTKLAVTVALLFAGVSIALGDAPKLLTMAVFDFEANAEDKRTAGADFSSIVTALLSVDTNLVLVERADLEKILSEVEFGLSGTVQEGAAVQVGKMLGAKILVTGRLLRAGDERIAVAKVIGAETTRVYGLMAKAPVDGSLADLAADLAGKIGATTREQSGTLTATTKSRESRLETLREALGGAEKPSVAIHLPEQHFGAPVIDPAAETELARIFESCGFKIIDWKRNEEADIRISGEAFSAFGMRRGSLNVCKSRVEVKVNRRGGAEVIMDRQMGVAIDLTEQTAAKLALQNAAFDLAERLAPKLVGK